MVDNGAGPQERVLGDEIIVSDGVKKWFGDFQALKGVTTTVREREVVVIIGPSGSGKSTFIRCINRLEAHQEGTIIVDGTELTNDIKNIEKIRSEVGMVFQQFNLFPHLTVLENLMVVPPDQAGESLWAAWLRWGAVRRRDAEDQAPVA